MLCRSWEGDLFFGVTEEFTFMLALLGGLKMICFFQVYFAAVISACRVVGGRC